MTQPLVTIAICTYDRCASLDSLSLSAIEKLTYLNYEVIIIDDCSPDETQNTLEKYQDTLKNLRIFRNEPNRGTPFSRNRVLENAQGEIIVFIDDDVSLFPDCLDEIVKQYTENSEVMFAWGCVYQCHGLHDRNVPTFGTGSLFSMRRVIATHFRFDTNIRYFKTYVCEEHDFARRLQRAGIEIYNTKTARANHYQSPAKNRVWRGLEGVLKVFQGSLNYLDHRETVTRESGF